MPKEGSISAVKLVCSYGGRILPRRSDGELRYVGGLTRVLSVDPFVSYSELMVKLSEFCGFSATLRCQLPAGDLETLVSVKSDEDLANLLETYDGKRPQSEESAPSPLKIRAVLTPASAKEAIYLTTSPPSSIASSTDVSPNRSPRYSPRMWLDRRSSCSPPPPPAGLSSSAAYRTARPRNYPCCYGPVPTPRAACAVGPPCHCKHWQLCNPNSSRIRIN